MVTRGGATPAWYLRRVRQMSVPEVVYRVRQWTWSQAERRGLVGAWRVPAPFDQDGPVWTSVPAGEPPERYVRAAEAVLRGELDVLGLDSVAYGHPPRWNRDPRTGREAPLTYGRAIDYRDPRVVGDIKYLWEPNRHHQWVWLAQAWALTGDDRFLDGLAVQLESWLDQCPYPRGPNWSSGLELGIRLINWAVAWQLIGGRQSPLFAKAPHLGSRWLAAIYRHQYAIHSHWSAYSSANNHRIGEAAGLLVAAVTWPCWRRSARWRARSHRILEEEILLQHTSDGVNREQATGYMPFVLSFACVAGRAADRAGMPLGAAVRERLHAAADFLDAVADVCHHVPMFGDADDGVVTRLDPAPDADPFATAFALVGGLLDAGRWARRATGGERAARWLGFVERPPCAGAATPARQAFPEGGYVVLGEHLGTTAETRLVMDAGPLGLGRLAAHGHADALSVTLSVGGHEVLIDPGTFDYYMDPVSRRYFRSTPAHNTIEVDGRDQSEMGGTFLWLSKAHGRFRHVHPAGAPTVAEGWHDGYRRLPRPVRHVRRVALVGDGRFQVTDRLEGRGTHTIRRSWHFAEDWSVVPIDGGVRGFGGGWRVEITSPGVRVELVRGREAPMAGWVSRRFGRRSAATTVIEHVSVTAPVELTTEILVVNEKRHAD